MTSAFGTLGNSEMTHSGATIGDQGSPGDPRKDLLTPGLTHSPVREWPRMVVPPGARPIDYMTPGSELHARVLNYLITRMDDSERAMTKFHARWRANEQRYQGWVDLDNWEQALKEANDSGKAPKIHSITIPYSFAVLQTIATYVLQVFAGRKPMMTVSSYGGPMVESAMKMEIVLQYQLDHNSFIKHLWQWINDAGMYGFGALINTWDTETSMRTRPTVEPVFDIATGGIAPEQFREQQEVTTFEGNRMFPVDPFMFYPDPRVPMYEVASKGEYVFWREYLGKHTLKRLQQKGKLKWVDSSPTESSKSHTWGQMNSARSLISGGDPHAGGNWQRAYATVAGRSYYKVDTCSIDLVPRELGLGPSTNVEKWLFSFLNDGQIVQAERLLNDHGEHPVVVTEPWTMGYAFGSMGIIDWINPFQDSMSWFMNSHMDNVRKSINDMFVVDPNLVEMKDMKSPEPGKLIRLKKTALNRDVRTAVSQLAVTDVTRGHVSDMNTFFELGQRVSAVSENLLGLQDSGGRKTATEVRTASEAAASRLAAITRVMSAQGMTRLTNQMSLNTQQFMSDEFYIRVVGPEGQIHPLTIPPEDLVGDFYFPIHDGTLPLDKIARFDLWREILVGVLQDPELRVKYDVSKIFEFTAELGGAKNIQSFRSSPDQMVQKQAMAGNMVPSGNGAPGAAGRAGNRNIQAAPQRPAARLQQGGTPR